MSEDIIKANIKDKRFTKVEQRIEKMQTRAREFCQTRSNFQIEKFIACDEYTPITQFRHVGHNSYVAMQEIRRMMIERERKTREIEFKKHQYENYNTGKKYRGYQEGDIVANYDLDVYELSRQLEDIEIRISGLSKEVDYMESICDTLEKEEIKKTGTGFTAEKFQASEPEYWRLRLATQMHRSQMGNQLGVGEGNYNSLLQAMEDPILPDSNQQINPIPFDVNGLAATALKDRDGVADKLLQPAPPPNDPNNQTPS